MFYGFAFCVWNYWWSCGQQYDHREMSVRAMKLIGPEEDEEVRLIEITSLSENKVYIGDLAKTEYTFYP